jgi:indolepyruvate ferredoxin oxidoreductase alpha subunit
MSQFKDIAASPPGSKFILQGNTAFALGVVHAGFHAADGYPGTPSTEVIDKALAHVQDRIEVGWSVNEAVAVGLGVGRAIAGFDCVVTMKIPGVFQAGDVISTSAFYPVQAGALVIYAATDYTPSSTQHVVDARYFFSSLRLPVLEPRDHQEMYDIARTAADMSKTFNTPVVVLASGTLAHSEGLVISRKARTVTPKEIPENLKPWMLTPPIARANYNKATAERIPAIRRWLETSELVHEIEGDRSSDTEWGVITIGETSIVTREALQSIDVHPPVLTLAAAYPLPEEKIKSFAGKIEGKLLVIEDGDKYLEERLRLLGLDVIGKDEYSTLTIWTPEDVLKFLAKHVEVDYTANREEIPVNPLKRPPSNCPGCPYRAFGVTVAKLKKKKKLYASFGDIGCSTLLYFLDSLDTVLCMGASDSMRQGFVLSRPDMAARTISVIGDSCECHSGLDATRNAVFRNVPGVKVILDNSITAMTGGQPAPSSPENLTGQSHKFELRKAVEAEVERTVTMDAYNLEEVERELKKALELAETGIFTALILEGPCIRETESWQRVRTIDYDYEICKRCGLCVICPGIETDDDGTPHFTSLCANCGGNEPVCMQRCVRGGIVERREESKPLKAVPQIPKPGSNTPVFIDKETLPETLRVAIRGIGGQGNLFFGKVLAEVALRTPYANQHIVKGDTHGMAQLGGSVISTFSCGNVFSPHPAPRSVDVLVVMEVSEVLRPGFLDLLKPGGTIIINQFSALPVTARKEEYPLLADIEKALESYNIIKIDANDIAQRLGDRTGRTANSVVLGLLSTLEPFCRIPGEIWSAALISVSPSKLVKAANLSAFEAGQSYLQ